MILCIGTTPAAQRVMLFRKLALNEVNRAASTLDGIAGKSVNVAKVLKTVGESPQAVGFAGGDRGEEIRKLLSQRQIDHEFITVPARTRQCITAIDESSGTQTELVEESQPVSRADYQALREVISQRIAGARAAIMSGSLTPGGPENLYLECVRMSNDTGALSVVDARGLPLELALKARPGLVKPNRAELSATVGRELTSDAEVLSAMWELNKRGAQRVVVTAGAAPALAFDGKTFWRVTPPRAKALNPIGSGDSFTAGLVWRLLQGLDLGEACRWGTAAGTANALTPMPGELRLEDVMALVRDVVVEQLPS